MSFGAFTAAAFVVAAIVGLFNRRASMPSHFNVWAVLTDGPCAGDWRRMPEAQSVFDVAGQPGVWFRYVAVDVGRGGVEIGDGYMAIRMRYVARLHREPLPVDHKWNQE